MPGGGGSRGGGGMNKSEGGGKGILGGGGGYIIGGGALRLKKSGPPLGGLGGLSAEAAASVDDVPLPPSMADFLLRALPPSSSLSSLPSL